MLSLLIPGSWAFAQTTSTPAPVTVSPASLKFASRTVSMTIGAGNVNGLISIVVTPANPSIPSGETQQFTATGYFRGGSRQNLTALVVWASSAPGVATIKAGGLASGVSPGSTTITATWVTFTPLGLATGVTPGTPIIPSPPKRPISGSTTLTVTATAACGSGSESLLSGQYAFSLSGFNASGFQALVGSFTADGSGHITAGEVDAEAAPFTNAQFASINTGASSYSVGSNHLGCATIATSFGTFNTRFALGSLSSNIATEGRVIEWDSPNSSAYIAAGQIRKQTPADFTAGPSGSYALILSGADDPKLGRVRLGIAGVLTFSGGSLSNGEVDGNSAGTTGPITGITGTYESVDANGRFRAVLTFPSGGGQEYAFYMVSSSEMFIVDISNPYENPVMSGEAKQQSVPVGGFSNSSVSGNMVFYNTGLLSGPAGAAVMGLFSANGTGSVTATIYDDEAGTWKNGTGTCSYSVASNGRMTLGGDCGSTFAVFYLTAANKAVLLGLGSAVGIGQVEPQTGGPFTAASFSGTLYMGTLEVVNQAANTGVAVLTLNGSGGVSGTSDYTATYGQTPDQAFTDTVTVNPDGTFSTASHPGVIIGIIISSTKSVTVDNESSTNPTIQVTKQ